MRNIIIFLISLLSINAQGFADSPVTEMRIGTVAFGTVNWEIDVIQAKGLDRLHKIRLLPLPLATPQAGKIALQSGAVDMIVSDWIWVSRQRQAGFDFAFVPYSNSAGALVVDADAGINSIQDLRSKRLGIAGGALDKNWLLMRALAHKQASMDLDQAVEKVFAAPPLLNHQMLQGKLDAIINYWHYAVPLEAKGYKRLWDRKSILQGLGIDADLTILGFVFSEAWAAKNKASVLGLLSASRTAKDLLCTSSEDWQEFVAVKTRYDKETNELLKQRYCEGRIKQWGVTEKEAATVVFDILHKFGGAKLTGRSSHLAPGTFWDYSIPAR